LHQKEGSQVKLRNRNFSFCIVQREKI
jgi:hypothetical protein